MTNENNSIHWSILYNPSVAHYQKANDAFIKNNHAFYEWEKLQNYCKKFFKRLMEKLKVEHDVVLYISLGH